MIMDFHLGDRADHYLLAVRAGAGVDPRHHCEHDDPVLALVLVAGGTCPCHPDALTGELQALVPVCAATDMIGAALASLRAEQGSAAADAFVKRMFEAYEEATRNLLRLKTQGRTCCEAGYRTGGREHTCGSQGDQT